MGWVLEVSKMFIYIMSPIGLFYFVNSPTFHENWVIKEKEECFPSENKQANQEIEDFIHDFNTDMQKKYVEALESGNK